MRRYDSIWGGVCLAILAAGMIWAQGIVVCPSCGREAAPDATECGHCKAKLPARGPKPKPVVEAPKQDPQAEIIRLAEKCVRDNVARMQALKEKQPAVAFFFAENALAVQRLLPPNFFKDKTDQLILDGSKTLLSRLGRARLRCRFCNGTGSVKMTVAKRDGTSMEGPKKRCAKCGGNGWRLGAAPVDQMKLALTQGRREYERLCMSDGHLRVGHLYLPEELSKRLSIRQTALVMTGMPIPCGSCQQTGRQSCTACKGTGNVKCTQQGCTNGEYKEKQIGRKTVRMNDPITKECPKCGGTGEIFCQACNGAGNLPCRKCSGSGVADACRRCAGAGILDCTKCRGTGTLRDAPCPDCKGELYMFCPSCRGEGAVAK
ncbi:MAG: hypothetical protein J6336_09785 [Kiritimatiellae bacterium]|nr:hypothetical protein [Kiritimatiellia bacterium]